MLSWKDSQHDECIKTFYSGEYVFKLKDFAFSARVTRSFNKSNINEIRFLRHLIVVNFNPSSRSIMNFTRTFHKFIFSMMTNRPIYCYGIFVRSAQRSLWSSEFADRPPYDFIDICNNHCVALLPISENAKNNERYAYFCCFMSDEKNSVSTTRTTTYSSK